ncbi:MAG: hypothetical protein ACFC1C_01435 [Candidatus Malihini olakiniferum]
MYRHRKTFLTQPVGAGVVFGADLTGTPNYQDPPMQYLYSFYFLDAALHHTNGVGVDAVCFRLFWSLTWNFC